MLTLLLFIGFILVLVGVHEGGHFVTAKLTGIAVEEFSLGFGPRLWSKKKGETLYSVRLLPLGGFVRLAGETTAASEAPFERTYYGRPAWARLALSAAGPAANIVLALAVLMAAVWSIGVPDVRVAGLIPASPAQEALQVGDTMVRIAGRRIWLPQEVGPAIQAAAPDEVEFEIVREGEPLSLSIRPEYSDELDLYRVGSFFQPQVFLTEVTSLAADTPLARAGMRAGDSITAACDTQLATAYELVAALEEGCRELTVRRDGETTTFGLPEEASALVALEGVAFAQLPLTYSRPGASGFPLSFRLLGRALADFVRGIRALVAGLVPAEEAVAGPVGIAGLISQGVQAGAWPALMLVALLSLNLAIINLLPFPALDGARMMFALWELLTRRKVSATVESAVHTVGFIILLGLILLITFWDVLRLFG